MSPVVVAEAVAGLLDGVLWGRSESTLRAPLGDVASELGIVPVYVEVVGLLHEGETLVKPVLEPAAWPPQLQPARVEAHEAILVPH